MVPANVQRGRPEMGSEIITRAEMLAIPAYEISDLGQLPSTPVVSVIVFTYNHEAYIEETIEGILAQQCEFPIELIIGEDKSKDRTLEICLDYQKKYPNIIRVVTWHENVGVNANVLRVWGRARGKYVATCDGDDYWIDPKKLAKQVALMEQWPGATLCGARTRILDDSADSNGKVVGPKKMKQYYGLEDVIEGYLFHSSTYLYRYAMLDIIQPSRSIVFLDYFYQLLSALKGELLCLPDIVSVYRQNDKGLFSGSYPVLNSERRIAVYQTLLPLMDERHQSLVKRRIEVLRSFLCYYLIDSGGEGEARRLARELTWSLARHNPRRAILMWCYVLAPGFHKKVKRLIGKATN
jgi:glycosyltransferase involved in cell wall biosynthesis